MANVQTRVFHRIVEPQDAQIAIAITNVTAEVNAFLLTLPNLGDVLDIRQDTQPINKYGGRLLITVAVIYVET